MITVHLFYHDVTEVNTHETGIYATGDENGWLSIIDADGFTLAVYPKDKVVSVQIEKAGETDVNSENSN